MNPRRFWEFVVHLVTTAWWGDRGPPDHNPPPACNAEPDHHAEKPERPADRENREEDRPADYWTNAVSRSREEPTGSNDWRERMRSLADEQKEQQKEQVQHQRDDQGRER